MKVIAEANEREIAKMAKQIQSNLQLYLNRGDSIITLRDMCKGTFLDQRFNTYSILLDDFVFINLGADDGKEHPKW